MVMSAKRGRCLKVFVSILGTILPVCEADPCGDVDLCIQVNLITQPHPYPGAGVLPARRGVGS